MELSWNRFVSILMTFTIGVSCVSAIVSGYSEEHHNLVDFSQAELMLRFLRSGAGVNTTEVKIDSILAAHGTQLIIQQQNISRRVTQAQYRELLSNLGSEEWPDIVVADDSERSRRGIIGLRNDVWPSLRWGVLHTELLQRRILALREIDISKAAMGMANEFLPKSVPLHTQLSVVMGGRAGAAALEGDDIYFDVLIFSYRDAKQFIHYPSTEQVIEFFAHEMHHVGMHQLIDKTQSSLDLNISERQAFRFLTFLVMEGSASYLINGHRNIEMMASDPEFAAHMVAPDRLIDASGNVLKAIFEKVYR